MKQDAPPVLGLITAAVLSSALHVDKARDAKLPCPANAALEQAIKVRLPHVKLGKADLRARITATEGGFRLELQRADGTVTLSRDLYSGCEQLGDTSALIIERYLAQLPPSPLVGERAGVRGPASEPKQPPEPEPTDAGASELSETVDAGSPDALDLISRIGTTPSLSPPPEEPPLTPSLSPTRADAEPVINLPPPSPPQPIVTGIEVSLAGGLWYGHPRVTGAFSLDVGVMLRDRVRLAVLALASTPITRAVENRGSVESFDVGAFAMLGVCTRTMLQLCGNAFAGARVTWAAASTTPDQRARLFRTGTGVISVPELGVLARAQVLFGRVLVAFDLLGGVPLISGSFEIEGLEPLRNPPVDLLGLLRVGVRL